MTRKNLKREITPTKRNGHTSNNGGVYDIVTDKAKAMKCNTCVLILQNTL